ncbi:hypothetical protein CY0110_17927 [Crocosphaera chwakensis CCY0110]|uniref:Uncharacterized protein n=1 Tax=Crocosphaera chwakensis CCY0110 TaxID=391612 RepID=A3IIR7_9CHRO|nr:hypothetical protein CY0110_17927 [Crocosphaera chwakensis CCY0110]
MASRKTILRLSTNNIRKFRK